MVIKHHGKDSFWYVLKKLIGLWTFWGRPKGSPRNGRKVIKNVLFCQKIPKEFAGVSDLDFGASGRCGPSCAIFKVSLPGRHTTIVPRALRVMLWFAGGGKMDADK